MIPARIRPDEHKVFAAQRHRTQRRLHGVGVDFNAASQTRVPAGGPVGFEACGSLVRAQLTATVDDGEIEVRCGDTAVIVCLTPNQTIFGMVLRELLQSGL
jgi:hypothetical protein